ncbi:MAG: hypothetical protein K6U02_07695 [Firmicutes bacterium]|nr:hypothetical protein [Bacillota bacterium]
MIEVLDPSLETALNEQLHRELESEYLYLSIAGAMEHAGFPGFARFGQPRFLRIEAPFFAALDTPVGPQAFEDELRSCSHDGRLAPG